MSNQAFRQYSGGPTKVNGVNWKVKISIFCAFLRTSPWVFIRSSPKLGKMCRINLQKNVRSRNFEFLTQSIFTWGQTLLKYRKSKTRYFFAIQFSVAFHLVRIRTQLFYIFNWNLKILIFDRMRAKNTIIYANFNINSHLL